MPELTPLGGLLEHARDELRISAREAARRSGISETRWRQIVTGRQNRRGEDVQVNPKARTVVALALAVQIEPAAALAAAGIAVPAGLSRLVDDVRAELSAQPRSTARTSAVTDLSGDERRRLDAEIARIEGMRLPASAKLAMLEALIRVWEGYANERGTDSAAG